MDYTFFINYPINRDKYLLPNETKKKIDEIKKKLNIFNSFKSLNFVDKPVIKKNIEIINNLYKLLNKITTKTYDKLSDDIIKIVTEENIDNDTKIDLCKKFFDIITKNKVYSELYAKLYKSFIEQNNDFKEIFKNELFKYLDSFNDIKYVSSNEDYEKYCLYNEQIDKINNFTHFLITSVSYDVCNIDELIKIILLFQNKLKSFFDNEDKIYENDCYISNIYTILKSVHIQKIISNNDWNLIKENNKFLNDFIGPGKNNKIKFKIMDINDIINKII